MNPIHNAFNDQRTGQMELSLGNELSVDLFAGAGGASVGAAAALGRPVDIAINHNKYMLGIHAHNHPQTKHYISDVFEVCPHEATGGLPVGLLHFSSDCRHFSRCVGRSKRDEKIRALTWVALRWAYQAKPRYIQAENVEEIMTWGPLDENGKIIKDQQGIYYEGFLGMLTTGVDPDHPALESALDTLEGSVPREALIRGLGYQVEWRTMKAHDYGVPTIRKRWYMIARRDGRAIHWPKRTHGPGLAPYRGCHEVLDFNEPMASIFLSKSESDAWSVENNRKVRRPLTENTLRRIRHGVQKFVLDCDAPFLVRSESGVKAYFMGQANTGVVGRRVDHPLSTVCSKASHQSLIEVDIRPVLGGFIVPRYGERPGQAPRCRSVLDPIATITPTANEGNLCVPILMPVKDAFHVETRRAEVLGFLGGGDDAGVLTIEGELYAIVDIAMRQLTVAELAQCTGFTEHYELAVDVDGKPVSQANQRRAIGNAVVPLMSYLMVKANFGHETRFLRPAPILAERSQLVIPDTLAPQRQKAA